MTSVKIAAGAAGVLFGVVVLGMPNMAEAECRPLPKVALWGDLSHDGIRSFVDRKLKGDWDSYLGSLERTEARLQDIYGRNKGVLIKKDDRKATLRGKKLRDYIRLSEIRIKVVTCLAEQAEEEGLANFATAAGSPDEPSNVQPGAPWAFGGGKKAKQPSPGIKKPYRTYLTLPTHLGEKLRQRAVERSIVEKQKVSVNDIIVRTLEKDFGRRGRR